MFGVWGFLRIAVHNVSNKSINNRYVRWPGKTRGAIGFALIFLCFVSLYQDKEMKK
jgi:hypothetical protein